MRTKGLFGIGLVLMLAVGVARADDKDPFAEYTKAATPGPEHKLLESLAGEWTFVTKFWTKPDEKPMEGKGTATRKMVLGGRFLQDDVYSKDESGEFRGIGLIGYDNLLKKYTSVWTDTMSSGLSTREGTYDKDKKTWTFTGEDLDAVQKKKLKGRDVWRIVDDNTLIMEMYKEMEGKEMKMMEITFTRKK